MPQRTQSWEFYDHANIFVTRLDFQERPQQIQYTKSNALKKSCIYKALRAVLRHRMLHLHDSVYHLLARNKWNCFNAPERTIMDYFLHCSIIFLISCLFLFSSTANSVINWCLLFRFIIYKYTTKYHYNIVKYRSRDTSNKKKTGTLRCFRTEP